jgi:hypothetical protein
MSIESNQLRLLPSVDELLQFAAGQRLITARLLYALSVQLWLKPVLLFVKAQIAPHPQSCLQQPKTSCNRNSNPT